MNLARATQFAVASERRFFAWLAGSIVVLVFVGFARTYYLHSFNRDAGSFKGFAFSWGGNDWLDRSVRCSDPHCFKSHVHT